MGIPLWYVSQTPGGDAERQPWFKFLSQSFGLQLAERRGRASSCLFVFGWCLAAGDKRVGCLPPDGSSALVCGSFKTCSFLPHALWL